MYRGEKSAGSFTDVTRPNLKGIRSSGKTLVLEFFPKGRDYTHIWLFSKEKELNHTVISLREGKREVSKIKMADFKKADFI